VAEFAPSELAASLGWTTLAAQQLMGDGLDLRYRLPRLWRLVLELVVPVHVARRVAELSRDLPYEAAGDADRAVAAQAGNPGLLSWPRIRALVDEARIYHDPERAIDDEQHALAARKVESWPGNTPATTDVFMRLDTADADAFNASVANIADRLAKLGDRDDLEIRRARAVGVLADPRRALTLLQTGADPGSKSGAPATLWLHLTDTTLLDLDTYAGAVTSERLGVLSTDLLKAWLADSTVVIKPVLDLSAPMPSTPTTRLSGWPTWSGSVTPSASFLVADAHPGPATSTTSSPTSRSGSAVRPARPIREASPHSAATTTASRPTATGTTPACPTVSTGGPARPAAPLTSSHSHPKEPHLPL